MKLSLENKSATKIDIYKSKAYYCSFMGIMLAVAVALTSIESLFSAFLPAGVRIGLSNIVIMAVLLLADKKSAFILVVLKSAFVLLTRGVTAGGMSFFGGILAFTVTVLLIGNQKNSYIFVSLLSSVAHSMGQLVLSCIITSSINTLYYAPVLIISSTIAGILTGVVLGVVLKHIKVIKKNN